MRKSNGFRWKALSQRQKQVLSWWTPQSAYSGYNGIIADGAIRSGKTFAMSFSFVQWAMTCYSGQQFAMCGKTIASFRRNVLGTLKQQLAARGYNVKEHRAENCMTVSKGGKANEFSFFGGKDESSQDLIQGITLAGAFFDEVALMPQSFVNQATARCSVTGSKFWFNCNPGSPQHWFYLEWVRKCRSRKMMYLHFTMEDNPALSPDIRSRYARLYSGVFYRRFVLGQWVAAEGRVYDFFDAAKAPPPPEGPFNQWYISCDYGTVNPASFGLWGRKDAVWYRVKEFYFDSRREQRQMTDAEYERALRELAGGRPIAAVIVDPSAASFLETLRRNGWNVRRADNDVLSGIRRTSDLLKCGRLVLCDTCTDCLREIEQYVWDPKAGRDAVRKEHDHAMDDMRYFVSTVLAPQRPALAACTAIRRA